MSTELRGTLHERGMRMTPQRQLVLDAVRALGHATPEAVCAHVGRSDTAVNISTVYRALDVLEDIGVLRHTHLGHGAPTYSTDDHPHVHLVCHRCEEVVELDPGVLDPLAREVRRTWGFDLDPAHLALSGVCRACTTDTDPPTDPARPTNEETT